jgi:ElaB/YqjD/DUF883 family membrane-anchored ribosome-binding protein
MFARKTSEPSSALADQAAQALMPAQQVLTHAMNGLAEPAHELGHDAAHLLNRAADQANILAQRGLVAMRESSQQLRDRARQSSESAVLYIKDKPVQAMLMAAAAGAVLMALSSLISRSGRRSRD